MWEFQTEHLSSCLTDNELAWLQRPYRLAEALQRVCNSLTVERLYQGVGDYLDDEAQVLSSNQATGYVREVFLCGDGVKLCFARTSMPLETYHAFQTEFDSLNTKLLGDTVLYPRSTARQLFSYTAITTQHPYHVKCQTLCDSPLAARRSVFHLNDRYPLLVTEVFLPAIPTYQHAEHEVLDA